MNPVLSILVVAALFAAFGLVRRERQRRCDGCATGDPDSCPTCPLREVRHD